MSNRKKKKKSIISDDKIKQIHKSILQDINVIRRHIDENQLIQLSNIKNIFDYKKSYKSIFQDIHILYKFNEENKLIQPSNIKKVFKHIKYVKILKYIFMGIKKIENNDYNIIPSIFIEAYFKKSIVPFWNEKIKILSKKIYLPPINPVYKNNINSLDNSWFSYDHTNCNDNNFKNYKLKIKKNEFKETDIVRTKQIKIYFNEEQRVVIKKIIGAYRYFYNRCVAYFNNCNKDKTKSYFYIDPSKKDNIPNNKIEININGVYCSYPVVHSLLKHNHPIWLIENFPSHLINQSIRECCNRFNTALKQYKKNGKIFKFKYKTKKQIIQTMNLEDCMISKKSNSIFVNFKYNDKRIFKNLKLSQRIPKTATSGSISYHTVLKTFMFNINYNSKTKNEDYKHKKSICASDPGVRCPNVIYSPTETIEIGSNFVDVIEKLCKEIDIIQSRIKKGSYYLKKTNKNYEKEIKKFNHTISNDRAIFNLNKKRKKDLRMALHRKIRRITNLRKELHNKTINYLCKNYRNIILPPFETQKLVIRNNRKINSKTARRMMTFAFYQFKQKLLNKGVERNVNVKILSEAYTTMTCGNCGILHRQIGSNKIFKCPSCNLIIDRDINAARNILLRNIRHF